MFTTNMSNSKSLINREHRDDFSLSNLENNVMIDIDIVILSSKRKGRYTGLRLRLLR